MEVIQTSDISAEPALKLTESPRAVHAAPGAVPSPKTTPARLRCRPSHMERHDHVWVNCDVPVNSSLDLDAYAHAGQVSVPAQLWCTKLFCYYGELSFAPHMKRHFRSGKNSDLRDREVAVADGIDPMQRGEIWLVDLEPARDFEANKLHPPIVASNDVANATASRLGQEL